VYHDFSTNRNVKVEKAFKALQKKCDNFEKGKDSDGGNIENFSADKELTELDFKLRSFGKGRNNRDNPNIIAERNRMNARMDFLRESGRQVLNYPQRKT
jgi:hypothetical protein